jgi:succinate dehydrogenase/fumarate reductase flavoprotein subunit
LEKLSAELRDISAPELENMTTVGMLIATAALGRRESRGVHFRRDYPERNDEEWKKNIVLKRTGSGIETAVASCR